MQDASLSIRRFRPADAPALFALLSDPRVMQYLEPPFDYEKTAAFLEQAGLGEPPLIYAVENGQGEFVGYVIYHPYDEASLELGWVLNTGFWGRGYGDALTKMLIEASRGQGKRLLIECVPQQAATGRIALKNGFSYMGNVEGLEQYVLCPEAGPPKL